MEIKLTLPPSAVQYIINALEERPHKEVRGLIDTIMQQSNDQLEKAEKVEGGAL